ncbi:MAG: TonB-dependent receptor [Bacteroidales bacterium]|nr:TonB-dependent receptor [Candidatus Physcousia equi]
MQYIHSPRIPTLLFILMFALTGMAQEHTTSTYSPSKSALEGMLGIVQMVNVRGIVYDSQKLDGLPGAQVKLAKPDGTLVAGAATNEKGHFLLQNVPSGTYRINISFIGYKSQNFSVTLPKKGGNFKVQDVLLREDAQMMKETVVEGKLAEMTVVDDTVIYNADAFQLPDGAVVEELIKKLPGITIDDDGNYVFNGKTVSQFLVDGKEFFGGNRELILKNLPAEIVEKVKAYDKKSDRARITGIDDGEEQTVLDLIIKKDRKQGWFGNVEGSYGSRDRYAGRLNVNHFKGDNKYSFAGNGDNTGGNGMTDNQRTGLTMNIGRPKIELNGSLTGTFSQASGQSWSNSQNFELSSPKYNNNHSWNGNHNNGLNFQYKVEWKPDSTWNILFRPDLSWSKQNSHNDNNSAQFNDDPYRYTPQYDGADPLDIWDLLERDHNIGINHRRSSSRNESSRLSVNGSLQVNKRLGKRGRNVTLNVNGGYGNNESESNSWSQTDYLQSIANAEGILVDDSVYHKVQFNRNPSLNYNVGAQLSYSEPILQDVYLQLSYRINYRFTDNQRNIRSIFDNFIDPQIGLVRPPFGPQGINIHSYRNFYDSPYVVDDTLQMGYTTNDYVNHDIRAQVRINRTKFNLTVGGNLQPQYNAIDYVKGARHIETSRTVVNASPTVDFRYNFSRQEQFNFRYNGNTGQPSITDMIPGVLSDNDPLNIRYGNPDLKPSFTQSINMDYRHTLVDAQRTNAVNLQFRITQNSTTNRTEYNEDTGGRVSMPVNVNGNWSGSISYNFNTALGEAKYWRINNSMHGSMNNNIGYQYNSREKETVRTRTRSSNLQESLRFTYRRNWAETGWEFEANASGNVRYNINRSTNPNAQNLNVWNFGASFSAHLTFPWGMQLNTDLSETSRRGYADAAANNTRVIWNASISQRLLKRRILTLSLRAVDILNQRDDINRNVGATYISDSHSEMVSSYVVFSANLRFGKFGGRKKR